MDFLKHYQSIENERHAEFQREQLFFDTARVSLLRRAAPVIVAEFAKNPPSRYSKLKLNGETVIAWSICFDSMDEYKHVYLSERADFLIYNYLADANDNVEVLSLPSTEELQQLHSNTSWSLSGIYDAVTQIISNLGYDFSPLSSYSERYMRQDSSRMIQQQFSTEPPIIRNSHRG